MRWAHKIEEEKKTLSPPEKSLAKVFFSTDIFSFLTNANFFFSSCRFFRRKFLPVVVQGSVSRSFQMNIAEREWDNWILNVVSYACARNFIVSSTILANIFMASWRTGGNDFCFIKSRKFSENISLNIIWGKMKFTSFIVPFIWTRNFYARGALNSYVLETIGGVNNLV